MTTAGFWRTCMLSLQDAIGDKSRAGGQVCLFPSGKESTNAAGKYWKAGCTEQVIEVIVDASDGYVVNEGIIPPILSWHSSAGIFPSFKLQSDESLDIARPVWLRYIRRKLLSWHNSAGIFPAKMKAVICILFIDYLSLQVMAKGIIPPVLSQLQSLRVLDFYNNSLSVNQITWIRLPESELF